MLCKLCQSKEDKETLLNFTEYRNIISFMNMNAGILKY